MNFAQNGSGNIVELELKIKELEKQNRELKQLVEGNKIVVNTDIGDVAAGVLAGSDYPGIYIDLKHHEDEVYSNGVTIEYDSEEKDYIIRVWEKDEEDYVYRRNWTK